jgi:hypothetical protein
VRGRAPSRINSEFGLSGTPGADQLNWLLVSSAINSAPSPVIPRRRVLCRVATAVRADRLCRSRHW